MLQGQVPPPESFESVTVFLCDIVQFTNLSSESTAQQVIEMLNTLYSMFDERIDSYNVYKVSFLRWLSIALSAFSYKTQTPCLQILQPV